MVVISSSNRRSRGFSASNVFRVFLVFISMVMFLVGFMAIRPEETTSFFSHLPALQEESHQERLRSPPKTKKVKDKQILTYNRFGGRLNNQLFQFVAALQHAAVLNRTLVVPPETKMVEWTAMFDDSIDLWDLTDLNAHYDIDWDNHAKLPTELPEKCTVKPGKHGKIFHQEWDDCPVMNIGGQHGLLFCQQHRFCGDAQQERVAYDIYSRLHLSANGNQVLRDFLASFKKNNYLAVHSRTHGDGPYPSKMCLNGNVRTCTRHFDKTLSKEYCQMEMLETDCAKWKDLPSQLPPKIAKKLKSGQPFVLANDQTHDWSKEYPYQFRTIPNAALLKPNTAVDKSGLKSPYALNIIRDDGKFQENLDRLSQTVLELFSMTESTYFVGNIYSTLSLAVCMIRGEERKYDSNMCWILMHPETRHAVPPSS